MAYDPSCFDNKRLESKLTEPSAKITLIGYPLHDLHTDALVKQSGWSTIFRLLNPNKRSVASTG